MRCAQSSTTASLVALVGSQAWQLKEKKQCCRKSGLPVAKLRFKGQIGICENIPVAEKYKRECLRVLAAAQREKAGVGSNRTEECSCWNRHTPTDMPGAFILGGGGQPVQPGLLKPIWLKTSSAPPSSH